jgi:surface carbohydrate biosynthesis protein
MKKILVLSNNAARDYGPDSIFKIELEKLGHFVWHDHFLRDDGKKVMYIKPDIVVVPEIRVEYTDWFAKQCRHYGIKVVVKMCEFGCSEEALQSIHPEYKKAIFGRFNVNESADLFISWGPKMKEMMVEHMGIDSEKIFEAGGFQFDPYYLPKPTVNMRTGERKTVLFAGGFPYADRNPEYAMPEAESNHEIQSYFVNKDATMRGKFLNLIRSFCDRYKSKYEVFYKPHPGERNECWNSVLKNTGAKSVANLTGFMSMQDTDFLVHSGSTMGFEAHLMGIPSINVFNNCEDPFIAKSSPLCHSEQEFFNLFRQLSRKRKWVSACPTETKKAADAYYGSVDGYGNRRAAVAVDALEVGKTTFPDNWVYPTEWKYPTPGVIQLVEVWTCDGCKNRYHLDGSLRREMVKCPYCGIANVKINPEVPNGTEQMQEVRDAGHPSGPDVQQSGSVLGVRKTRPAKKRKLGPKKKATPRNNKK